VPSTKIGEGKISISYLEELCEWVYYHDVYTDEEKLKHILSCETMIRDLIDKLVSPKCGYKPTWSPKIKDKIKKNNELGV
jgi:hypothetical protein